MKKGIFYEISVGPGDPELLTLKAVRLIKSCHVIAAPQTGQGKMTALDIVKQAVKLEGQEILPLHFSMSCDPAKLEAGHRTALEAVLGYLQKGQDVAMLTLGDVSVYATCGYLTEPIRMAGFQVTMVAGVPSFCAAAAALGISLTKKELPLHIIPAGYDCLEENLSLEGTKVLMKSGSKLPQVKKLLKKLGNYKKASLVANCGMTHEKICHSLEEADFDSGYFTTIIIKE